MLLNKVLNINKISICPLRFTDKLFYCFSLPAFDNRKEPESLYGRDILSSKFILDKSCILFNKLNVRFKRIWNIKEIQDNYICSTEYFPLIVTNSRFLHDFVYYYLTSDAVNNKLIMDRNGTSSSHQRIELSTLLSLDIPEFSINQQQHIVNTRRIVA